MKPSTARKAHLRLSGMVAALAAAVLMVSYVASFAGSTAQTIDPPAAISATSQMVPGGVKIQPTIIGLGTQTVLAYYLDGMADPTGIYVGSSPYSAFLDTTKLVNTSQHVLGIKAFDNLGGIANPANVRAQTAVNFTVTNSTIACTTASQCQDTNPCTTDSCSSTGCRHDPAIAGTPCPGGRCSNNGICSPNTTGSCGNSIKEGAEQCDVGSQNGTATSCCSETCTFKTNASVCRPLVAGGCSAQRCNGTSDTCPNECSQGGNEFCTALGKSCVFDSTTPVCFRCTGGTLQFCGDRVVQPPEQCDDGNTVSGDGCSAFCKTETAAPTINSVSPNIGPLGGGITVVITGTNFTSATGVKFGTAYVPRCVPPSISKCFRVVSDTQICTISPFGIISGGINTVDVTVTTPGGISAISKNDTFSYFGGFIPDITNMAPGSGPSTGRTSVAISGMNFVSGATTVMFGNTRATSVIVSNASFLQAVTPAGTGQVPVTITTPSGTSVRGNFTFTYTTVAAGTPIIKGLAPFSGSNAGGTTVIISGENFTDGATVKFAGISATNVRFNPANSTISAVSPPGANTVDVTVTTAAGTSPLPSTAGRFIYTLTPPIVCGNGIVQTGEQCDLGSLNGTAGSCCTTLSFEGGTRGCTFKTSGTICTKQNGIGGICNGVSGTCP